MFQNWQIIDTKSETRGTKQNLQNFATLARQVALCYCDTAPRYCDTAPRYCDTAPRHCTPPLGQLSPLSSSAAAALTPTATAAATTAPLLHCTDTEELLIGDHTHCKTCTKTLFIIQTQLSNDKNLDGTG